MIGGGPAGAAVARLLALRAVDVVVLEATAFGRPRFGETLPPEANPLLRELGARDALTGAVQSPGTISSWGSSDVHETDFVANRHGCGWHVDRNAFDASLCRAAADAGVRIMTGTRATRCSGRDDGTWYVETDAASNAAIRARYVIDASGRNGFRLEGAARRVVDDALVAVFLRLTHSKPPRDLRTLVESAPDGWWYCAPVPSGETVAAFVTDPTVYANDGVALRDQLAQAPLARARIGDAQIVDSHIVQVSSSVRAPATGDAWAAAGDAAAAYDPLSGYGITKGLRDAGALADAVVLALRGDPDSLSAYADRVRRAFDAYSVQRRAYYALETRWADRTFWKNRTARG